MPSRVGYSAPFPELVKKALANKQITKAQANAFMRHKSHHSEGHLLFMLKAVIDNHLTFGEAHKRAMAAVGN